MQERFVINLSIVWIHIRNANRNETIKSMNFRFKKEVAQSFLQNGLKKVKSNNKKVAEIWTVKISTKT